MSNTYMNHLGDKKPLIAERHTSPAQKNKWNGENNCIKRFVLMRFNSNRHILIQL